MEVNLTERQAKALVYAVGTMRDLNHAAMYPHPDNGFDHTDLTTAVTVLNHAIRQAMKPVVTRR